MTIQSNFRPALPNRLVDLQSTLKQCLTLLEQGRTKELYAFVWYEEKATYNVEVARTTNTSETRDRGIVFRVMCNGVQFESASNSLETDELIRSAKALRSKVDKQCPIASEKPYVPTSWTFETENGLPVELTEQIPQNAQPETPVHFAPTCEQDPDLIRTQTLLELAQQYRNAALERATAENGHLKNASELADIQLVARFKMIYNLFVDREKTLSQALPISLIAGGGVTTTGQSARVSMGGLGTLELIKMNEEHLQSLAIVPQELSVAEKLKPGRYKVITGPGVSGVIAHEAFGHTQEGDTWMKGRSIARTLHADKVRVGNDLATIMNNPAVFSMEGQRSGCNGSYFFDNEGQLSRPQTILDKGYLSTPMTDLTSAQLLNVDRTANGKRESWRRPLMARQTNTYFTPGDHSLEELIGMVSDGFLARTPHGGMEDPKGGSLTAGAGYFEEIKEGQLTGKKFIGPAGGHVELTDSVFDVLDRIEAKSKVTHETNTPEVKLGGCGKYHKELVDAGVGGPFILWNNINCG
jgi:predicted Zn-dependent protease